MVCIYISVKANANYIYSANMDFSSLRTGDETKIDDILDNLLTDDSLDISINAKGIELFTTSSLSQTSENAELEELLISFSRNEDSSDDKSFNF